ncbi:MAG: 4Fe-4S binding protein [Rhodospirillales bacterium]|nr:MAG: 4Fe-4S binding protein [Rhodospirillales bacterium]
MTALTLEKIGALLLCHQDGIRRMQWAVVGIYLFLVGVPAFLDLPSSTSHLWNDLVLLAQFVFWGVWWPLVLVATVLFGRVWCGFFCPEGTLTEWASRKGRGLSVPSWIRWGGWPFAAFVLTTLYGQMISVYQYPRPALLILGGSTLAAIAVGALYGRNKRVWCRYLCPVNGVFALLAKLSPLHFKVDQEAWHASQDRHAPLKGFVCAPLVAVRTMKGGSACHMCGRCNGFRDAVALSVRSPVQEIVKVAGEKPQPWETALVLFGLSGVAMGAFHWQGSFWFIALKQGIAEWLVERDLSWPLEAWAPWWLLTNYPMNNDVMTLLDGGVLIIYVAATALLMGTGLAGLLLLASLVTGRKNWKVLFHHLAQGLIPLAGAGVVLGLSGLTVSLLRAEGIILPGLNEARLALLALGALASLVLGWKIAGHYAKGWRRVACTSLSGLAVALGTWGWS